jgi:Phage integrase family
MISPLPDVPAATGMHDLRHYYASLLIRHGESVKTVQRRLGHATAAETPDTYSHLWPDSDDRTREAVDAILTAVPPACREQGRMVSAQLTGVGRTSWPVSRKRPAQPRPAPPRAIPRPRLGRCRSWRDEARGR